jgi:uncharacterized protein (DUF885 family)/acetyl esterase/lipase
MPTILERTIIVGLTTCVVGWCVPSLALAQSAAITQPAASQPTVSTATVSSAPVNAELRKIFDDYHEQYLILFPLEATNFGDSRYNDQLPISISEDFLAKEQFFYRQILERLTAIDTTTADDTPRLMAEILRYELETRLAKFPFHFERIPFNQFDGLPLTFAQFGSGASSQPFKTVKDYENWLKRIAAFTTWSQVAIERFQQGLAEEYVLPKVLVYKMVTQLLDDTIVSDDPQQSLFWGPINKLPESFSQADRERLTVEYRRAISEQVIPSYRRLGEFLRDEYLPAARESTGISALEGGREQYQYWVRYWTTTDLTPDQIFELGEQEVQRITAEMEQVKAEMGFSGSLAEYFEYLRSDPQFKPFNSPEEVLDFFRALQAKLQPQLDLAFLRSPKTPFEIRRTEAFREKTASAEYMPGSADGTRPGIFYCPIPDAKDFNITSGMESLFLHEALPGHHYQVSLQQENQQLPQFARLLWYGAYGEGWALYCESIGKELGLYTDARQKMGALGDEMHRAIRLVVDVGMHWKGWTREEAIEYMMAHEPIAEEGAVAEIERYMAFTAQALSYKIGQLKISELRRTCTQRLGKAFSLPAFHDQVLRNGCMPLSVLERRLNHWNGGETITQTKVIQDLQYATVNGHALKLDLYLPDPGQVKPRLVVWIHGGGWRGGSKAKPPIRRVLDAGYALASISYRFSDVAIFPAQLHDCKGAVRWLRARADEYGYDANWMAVAGSSAGGTLALLLGTTAEVPELEGEVGGNVEQSSQVQAVINYFGPSDFVLRGKTQPDVAYTEQSGSFALLGGKQLGAVDKQLELAASAAQQVTTAAPPLMVMHGTADKLVLMDQADRSVEAYQAHGRPVQLIVLEGAGHGDAQFFWGDTMTAAIDFLNQHRP